MIRVNLLRNLSAGVGPALPMSGGGIVSQDLQKMALMRLFFIFACLGALIFYEKLQLSSKQQEVDAVVAQINAVRAEKDTYGDAAPIVQKYNERKEELQKQTKILESLTENRLREVKVLDAIQSITPPKAWLEKLAIENGKVTVTGFAPDEGAVSGLYRSLEANGLFSNVKVKSEAKDVPGVGSVQRFEFVFNAGRVK